jgi:phage-related protein
MTQPGRAGRAAIEIVGDASKLGRQLQRDAQRAVNDVDLDTDRISAQIGDAFGDGVDEAIEKLSELNPAVVQSSENYARRFEVANKEVADSFGDALPDIQGYLDLLVEIGADAADELVLEFEEGGVRISKAFKDAGDDSDRLFDGIGDSAREAGDDVDTNLLRPMRTGFSRIGELIASAGAAFGGLLLTGTNPVGLATLALTGVAILAVIPLVIGLAAALADLAGVVALLPAGLGVLVGALVVGTVAFKGFGDALGAIIDGDPEKIAEAMERLAPAARVVAKEFQALMPTFKAIQQELQQGLFLELNGILTAFGTTTLPAVRNELRDVARSLGMATAELTGLLVKAENVSILERVLSTTSGIVEEMGEAFGDLGQAFLNATDAGLPSLEKLTDRLSGAITKFADFINTSIEDGSFQEFLDDAIATLDELLALGGAVGELLGVLFGGTDDAGRGFIGTLTDVTKRMTEFFKSAEGQDVIGDFVEIIEGAGVALGYAVNAIREVIAFLGALDNAANATIDWFYDLGEAIAAIWDKVVSAVSSAVDSVIGFFTSIGDKAASAWDSVTAAVTSAVDTIVAFVSSIPDRIGAFIDSIPTRIAAAFDLALDTVIDLVAGWIAILIVTFTELPGQIAGALGALGSLVGDVFRAARDAVVSFIGESVEFVMNLPTMLEEGWNLLLAQVVGIFNSVRDYVVGVWDDITSTAEEIPGEVGGFFENLVNSILGHITSIVNYVTALPGKIISAIGDAGKMLYDSGAKIIQGLIDGIKSRISQLVGAVSNAVQQIRDRLPFSPAKKGPLSGSGSPERAGATIGSMIADGLASQVGTIAQAAGMAAAAAGIPLSPLGEAGVTPLTSPIPGQRGTVLAPTSERQDQQTVFVVTIGGEEVYAIIDKRVEAAVQTEVRRLLAGTRGI